MHGIFVEHQRHVDAAKEEAAEKSLRDARDSRRPRPGGGQVLKLPRPFDAATR
ncbi:hypothetical protein [Amycolatopsis sp. VC5-11]|uniref:hypothetical protein n=1 Tax=Amycolatopsis sp. VC5-11 TaxID=3120156 RepID=UPI003008B523